MKIVRRMHSGVSVLPTAPRLSHLIRSVLLAAGSLALNASPVVAQAAHGVAVDFQGAAVAGVVVQLVDSVGKTQTQVLTNAEGRFRLIAPHPAEYRIRALHIGYRPTTTPSFYLAVGQDIEQRLVLDDVHVALDTVRAVGRSMCSPSDTGSSTFAVWEQARAALVATALTAAAGGIEATTVAYERTLDPDGRRTLKQSATVRTARNAQIWASRSVDSLRRFGYVVTDRENITTYYAPGIDVLASDEFIEDHCLHMVADRRHGDAIGISFEPTPDRKRTPEVRGTLWLDRGSAELRRIEFTYANVAPELADVAGGDMAIARLSTGAWAVSHWVLRMPVLEQRILSARYGGPDIRVVELRATGGDLMLVLSGLDTLWSAPTFAISGTIGDSASRRPIQGATVQIVGTPISGVSDARGRFVLTGVRAGQYSFDVRTSEMESLGAAYRVSMLIADTSTRLDVFAPSAAQIVGSTCPTGLLRRSGIVTGTVTVANANSAPASLLVNAVWVDSGGSVPSGHRLAAWTSGGGRFRLCEVPTNVDISVHVQGTDPASARRVVVREAGQLVRVDLAIANAPSATGEMTGVVLVDSTDRPVVGAEISLPELGRADITGAGGRFWIAGIPEGAYRVVVRRIGYAAIEQTIQLARNQTVDQRILLDRVQSLDSVVVTDKQTDRFLDSFEEHRRVGLGHFYTRGELEATGIGRLDQVFRQTLGTRIVNGRGSNSWLAAGGAVHTRSNPGLDYADLKRGAKADECYADVYLDNSRVYSARPQEPLFNLNSLSVAQIEAMEYYATPAQTPAKYSRIDATCGVLVIWTRRD